MYNNFHLSDKNRNIKDAEDQVPLQDTEVNSGL
jgi:hypothetical protein